MTARYTYPEFQAAGITPDECDGDPYPHEDGKYWFACNYHEGYIDGFTDALDTSSTPSGKEPAEKEEA